MPPVTMRWQSVAREPAFTDRDWSTTDGIELYARDDGAGEGRARLPVICLHGMTRNSAGPYLSTEGLMRLAGHAVHPAAFTSWDEATAFVRAQNAPAFPHLDDAAWLAFDPEIFRRLSSPKGAPFVFDMSPAYLSLAAGQILVVRGELSDVLDKAGVYRMQGLTRRFRYVEVKGVGHAPTLMEPEARAAIEAFLAEMP